MPTPAKKVPVRMCTGCREHKPKKELIRVQICTTAQRQGTSSYR